MVCRILLLCFVLLACAPIPLQAQVQKMAVEIVDRSDGTVGQRLVYQVKENFRRSEAFRLTDDNETRVQVIINAMPKFSDNESTATIYGIVWNLVFVNDDGSWTRIYYDSTIGYAGTDVLTRAAETIVSSTDRVVTELRRSPQ